MNLDRHSGACENILLGVYSRITQQAEEVDVSCHDSSLFSPSSYRCCEHGHSEQAIGVALESRRLDKLEEVIGRSEDTVKAIKYSLGVSQKLVVNRSFRQQVLRLLIRLYEGVPKPDYVDVCQCLMFLDDDKEVAIILNKLLRGSMVRGGVGRGREGR